ncbi:class I SAM-dependent methyltransferase [Jannaschia seohaensis]|uniref:Ubiquinone/menaquinone biosynthesis C-methylase UbiE n=1 Tax=Jannaschia seohaensis TaxID=475081 RepID=A0A2Y9B8U2_9RHOB|nr:class I SAM-dependent methyltransferase [Jannaschia seohaensis]PWJ09929.1 ubiquinone/menaquinone biosynthesis C-methylase UbiE [Jannaschia seohaensis]SSA51908.1 Ubiquinone/menaquinone biosynthesis C-methylase UbiE [Jannaschia seohaensis]
MAPATFAYRYQSVLVPVIFEPWARELIHRADPREGEHILDLACGTGVVSRQVAKHRANLGSLTGVDHSSEMLEVARILAEEADLDARWIEADAGALPFDDDCFTLAFCQQALQFFPDKPAALSELRRVLKPGGRVAACVQKELEINPMLKAQASALDAHVGRSAGDAVRAICGLPDGDEIRRLFEDAGFQDVEVEATTLILHHPDAKAFAEGAMGGMHTGDKLSGMAAGAIERAVDAFLVGLGDCLDGPAMHAPHVSNVITARA